MLLNNGEIIDTVVDDIVLKAHAWIAKHHSFKFETSPKHHSFKLETFAKQDNDRKKNNFNDTKIK